MKKIFAVLMAAATICFTGCGEKTAENTEVNVFIAASLNGAMTELVQNYEAEHPDVTINLNADSSGKLATQIEEGAACDIFFSAAQDKMDKLEADGLVKTGSRENVVNNQVVVIALKDSDTKVTGLANIGEAKSIALADGSVPVGAYTRTALMNMGVLPEGEAKSITTEQVSDALGGVEISEQENVSKVLTAVAQGACEVGTTYYSDTYGYEDKVQVLETVSNELTGDVIYPIALTENKEADIVETEAARAFFEYVTSDESKAVFDKYYFDTNVD
jgi:molybdate transport system substrate-binding protein